LRGGSWLNNQNNARAANRNNNNPDNRNNNNGFRVVVVRRSTPCIFPNAGAARSPSQYIGTLQSGNLADGADVGQTVTGL
jgi:hypothetical protein